MTGSCSSSSTSSELAIEPMLFTIVASKSCYQRSISAYDCFFSVTLPKTRNLIPFSAKVYLLSYSLALVSGESSQLELTTGRLLVDACLKEPS